jgi:hypothetical protein
MKTSNRITCLLILTTLFAFSSCKKDDNSSSTPGVVQIVTTGSWSITYFVESSENKTADFAGYTFSFNSNGQLTATLSGANTTGTWGWDDSSSKFHITMGSSKPLSDLTDDWLVLEKTETLIRLKNDNAAKNELLTFSRN